MKIAIVVVTYNRPKSLERLLNSLNQSYYPDNKIDLIISIDNSGKEESFRVADSFNWKNGKKNIITHKERLGLKKHVFYCGDLTREYENIIVLEDDIFVSPAFYNFSQKALKFYNEDEKIAGISLYTHEWNMLANRSFKPLDDESDVFFMQFAQSWGQIWTKNKWNGFKEWYSKNLNVKIESDDFPELISSWPDTSWLKYQMKYLKEKNKYFAYPKVSLTTNFSDVGQHSQKKNNDYQVCLQTSIEKEYIFKSISQSNLIYDIYFENEMLYRNLSIAKDKLCIDLYGLKNNKEKKKYLLTSKELNYKIIKAFDINFRPHENNIILENIGKDIYLYDTEIANEFKNKKLKIKKKLEEIEYDIKSTNRRNLFFFINFYYLKYFFYKKQKARK